MAESRVFNARVERELSVRVDVDALTAYREQYADDHPTLFHLAEYLLCLAADMNRDDPAGLDGAADLPPGVFVLREIDLYIELDDLERGLSDG